MLGLNRKPAAALPYQGELLSEQLAELRGKQPDADLELQRAALIAETTGDEAPYHAAVSTVNDLRARIDRIQAALPLARQQDDERRLREADEATRRQAELQRQANEANYNGWRKITAAWAKDMARLREGVGLVALAAVDMMKTDQALLAKLPDADLPSNDTWSRFGPRLFAALLDDELARAAAAHDVTLPGDGRVPDEPFDRIIRGIKDGLDEFARRVLIDGERFELPQPPPPPAPTLRPRYFLGHGRRIVRHVIDDRGNVVPPNSAIIEHQLRDGSCDRILDWCTPGWSRRPTIAELTENRVLGKDAEAMVWVDRRGEVLGPADAAPAEPESNSAAERLAATAQRLGIPLDRMISQRIEASAPGADAPPEVAPEPVTDQAAIDPVIEPAEPEEPPARPVASRAYTSADAMAEMAAASRAIGDGEIGSFRRTPRTPQTLADAGEQTDATIAADPPLRPVDGEPPAHAGAIVAPHTEEMIDD